MNDLIDLMYETVADQTIWGEVARRMSERFAAPSFWMFHMDSNGPDFLALQALSPSFLEAYAAHFYSRDVLMEEELRRPQDLLGRAVPEQDFVGETVSQASEIYNDLARPNGMHHVLSMNLSSGPTQPVPFLTFFRPPGTSSFDDAMVSSCEDIIPHLRRAIRLNRLISLRRRTIPEWTASLLDQIPAGIFLLDRRGAVLHAIAPHGPSWRGVTASPSRAAGSSAPEPRLTPDWNGSLSHAFRRIGVALNTVRTQVKSIFAKLRVGRQVDVAHLLAEVSALPMGNDAAGVTRRGDAGTTRSS